MKKIRIKNFFLLFVLFFGVLSSAQTKKWTLVECVNYALKNNISIKQIELDTLSADIEKKAAFGNFLPTFNANYTHSWNVGLNQNITTGLLQNQTTQFSSMGLSSNVSIYNGLQNQNKLRRAKLSILASQYQLSKMKDDVSLNVANAFLTILFNKENLKVQKQQLVNDEKQLNRADELVKVGSVPRGDLLDMKATVASDNQKVVIAENNLLLSKLSLAQLLQLDDFQSFDIADEDFIPEQSSVMTETPEAIIEKAKKERAELKIAKANLDIAEKDLKISKGAFQPRLIGFYAFDTRVSFAETVVGFTPNLDDPTRVIGFVEGTNQSVLQQNFIPVKGAAAPIADQLSDNKGHNFGLQLNIPVFNGFSVRNNVERSKLAFEKSKIAYSTEELNLERNVFTAFTDAKGALNTYESAISSLESREEAFNYAKEKYAVGMMNAFDYNQAQTLFTAAQSEVIRAKYDYIFKQKVVEFYFGIPIVNKQ
ncbi:TolC family protein [Flavobacterium sp. RSB2_4_14]|uniref:TolC family protein n=1 Tax=Flavobacterium sp. RSB2_4_14 TaxID=3447665 RepID=UPI003F2B9224